MSKVSRQVNTVLGEALPAVELPLEGYVARLSDGRYWSGGATGSICVMRQPGYLRRLAPVDAVIVPVSLVPRSASF